VYNADLFKTLWSNRSQRSKILSSKAEIGINERSVKSRSEAEKLASAVKTAAFKSGATLVGIVSAENIDAFPPV
jgi:hypothetical protein